MTYKKFMNIMSQITGLPAWAYLFYRDWKIAIALGFILWSYGLQIRTWYKEQVYRTKPPEEG